MPNASESAPSAGIARASRRLAEAAERAPPTAAERSVIERVQPTTSTASEAHATDVLGTAAISKTATPPLPAVP